MNRLMFRIKTGRWPKQDDLDRVNCPRQGLIGHLSCGWCNLHRVPMFQCLCCTVLDVVEVGAPEDGRT